jgi:hypothetical protein
MKKQQSRIRKGTDVDGEYRARSRLRTPRPTNLPEGYGLVYIRGMCIAIT